MRNKMFLAIAMIVTACLAAAPATRPNVQIDRGALEVRANQEFNSGNYAAALPMLQALADMSKDMPDALGPIQERIRVCQKNIANGTATTQPSIGAARTPHSAPKPGEVLDMPIKELGNFDFDAEKGGDIPKDVQKLSGSTVRLRGYMIPMDQATNITQFALVPDLFACCFGQPPQLQHTIVVNCPKGKSVSYFPDEIQVEGKLKVAEQKDEGFIISIFQVDVSSVKPAPK